MLLAELHLFEFLQQLFRGFGPVVLVLVLGYWRLRWRRRWLICRILRVLISVIEIGIISSVLIVIFLLGLSLRLPKWLITGEGSARRCFALRCKDHTLHDVRAVCPAQYHIVET